MASRGPAADPVAGLTTAVARVGREGALRLAFERRGSRTVLAHARSVLPLQVLTPLALDDAACVVSMLNPTGGVLGGDRLEVDVTLAPGAHACLTTPSATKVYRAPADPAVQRVRIEASAGAVVEWVPGHTIPFADAALVQSIELHVAGGARAIVVDAFAAGRVARGEVWRFAALESALVVSDCRGEILWDRWSLRRGRERGGDLTGARPYFATVAVIGDGGLDDFCAAAASLSVAGVTAAAGRLARRGALARVTAVDAVGLGRTVEELWAAARATMLGLPALALRRP